MDSASTLLRSCFDEWRVQAWTARVRQALHDYVSGRAAQQRAVISLCVLCSRQQGREDWERYLWPSERHLVSLISDACDESDSNF